MVAYGDQINLSFQPSHQFELTVGASSAAETATLNELTFLTEYTSVTVATPRLDGSEILRNIRIELTNGRQVEVGAHTLTHLAVVIHTEAHNALLSQWVEEVQASRGPLDFLILGHLELDLLIWIVTESEIAQRLKLRRVLHPDCHALNFWHVDVASRHDIKDRFVGLHVYLHGILLILSAALQVVQI